MTNAMHYGFRRTVRFLAGITAGFFIVMLVSGLLNVVVTGWLPALEKWLKILGAGYMFYLAFHIARSRPVEMDDLTTIRRLNTKGTKYITVERKSTFPFVSLVSVVPDGFFGKPREDRRHNEASFRAGFSMQFLNIKVILYGITVFSLFIIHSTQSPVVIGMYALALALIGFIAISCWGLGGNIFRKSLQKNYRWFNFGMAGLLVYTALASFFTR